MCLLHALSDSAARKRTSKYALSKMVTKKLVHQHNNMSCTLGTQLFYSNVTSCLNPGWRLVALCAMDILVKGNGLAKSCEVLCDCATSIGEVKRLFENELDIPSMELRP